jgi:ADP-ribose pyrophosphatase YjhB (NUDIX family)
LKTGVTSRIPSYATHQVGVGGLVLRPSPTGHDVLIVKEAREQFVNMKLPGGLAEVGEDFGAAAVREVKEETGVDTVFESLLTIRHQHKVQFNRSDIYVIALLKAGPSSAIVKDDYEIAEARWVDLEVLLRTTTHAMLKTALDVAVGRGIPLTEREHASVIPNRPPYKLYHAPLPLIK